MHSKFLFSTKYCVQLLAFFIYLINLLDISQAQWITEEESCRTPDNEFGRCISVYDCTPITDILNAYPKPLPPAISAKIREYRCDVNSGSVKVCCPSKPIELDKKKQEDLSRHRNYNLLPRNCGPLNDSDDKIINGELAGLFEFPWMALLSYRTKRGPEFKCGGAIINSRYILTAAHCIVDTPFPLLGVRIGEYNISSTRDCEAVVGGGVKCAPPVQDLSIEQTIAYPQDSSNKFGDDIGLIRVSRMNLDQPNAKPICLPFNDKQYQNIDGKSLIVTGWGATETGFASKTLLKVEIPAMTVQECAGIYGNEIKITDKQICGRGAEGKDACSGDSGGPMQLPLYHNGDVRYVIFGVVSFGTKRCDPNVRPGVYTRVGPYLRWILDNIRN